MLLAISSESDRLPAAAVGKASRSRTRICVVSVWGRVIEATPFQSTATPNTRLGPTVLGAGMHAILASHRSWY